MSFTEEDFNDFWLGPDGNVWKLITFADKPTATFARVDDPSIQKGGVQGSPILADFRRLRPE